MLAGMPEDEESSGGDEDGEAGAADDHAMEDASLQAFEGHGGVQAHHALWQTARHVSMLATCLCSLHPVRPSTLSSCTAQALHNLQLSWQQSDMVVVVTPPMQ
jgi:hypothetical protein